MNLGQVYTKRKVADFMVGLFSSNVKRILDPCFGGGVFVNSVLETTHNEIVAIEIDKESFKSFHNPDSNRCHLLNDSFFNYHTTDIDGIVMNPPYVRQEEIDDMAPLGVTKSIVREACKPLHVSSKSNLYIYFILKAAMLLKEGGELILIFPNTWRQTPDGKTFEITLSNIGAIERYINISGEPFEGSPLVEVCIIKFIKGSNSDTEYYDIKVNDDFIEANAKEADVSIEYNKMPLLSSIANIRRGVTTGSNKVFINPPLFDKSHIKRILSTPKNIRGFSTKHSNQDSILAIEPDSVLTDEELDTI